MEVYIRASNTPTANDMAPAVSSRRRTTLNDVFLPNVTVWSTDENTDSVRIWFACSFTTPLIETVSETSVAVA